MKKLLFLSLLAALLLAACGSTENEATPDDTISKDVGGGKELREGSLVRLFYEPDTLVAAFHSPSRDYQNLQIFVESGNWGGEIYYGMKYLFMTQGLDAVKKYQAYYGDTTYSQITWYNYEYCVSTMPLNSISITADRDFDAEHPAGSLLNDLFVLQYMSAYDVIKSAYDPKLDYAHWGYLCNIGKRDLSDPHQLIPLSEFEPINLMHSTMSLYFTKLPETLGEYTFTISFEYGTDPVSGKEASKIAPAVIKAEFTEADYVNVPVREPLNKGE